MGTTQATGWHEAIRAAVAVTSAVFGAWRGRCSSPRERVRTQATRREAQGAKQLRQGRSGVEEANNGCERTCAAKRVGGHGTTRRFAALYSERLRSLRGHRT